MLNTCTQIQSVAVKIKLCVIFLSGIIVEIRYCK